MQARYTSYKQEVFDDNKDLHPKAKDAAMSTLCNPFDPQHNLPQWKCVLRCCNNCPPLYQPKEETSPDGQVPQIYYHVYKTIATCSIHKQRPPEETQFCMLCANNLVTNERGKFTKRKQLVRMCTDIDTFHKEYYQPGIYKLSFHLPHVSILGKHHCAALRKKAFEQRAKKNFQTFFTSRLF